VVHIAHISRPSVGVVALQWRDIPSDASAAIVSCSPTGVGDWVTVAEGVTDPFYVHKLGRTDGIVDVSPGAILAYRVSVDGGQTWSVAVDTLGSYAVDVSTRNVLGVGLAYDEDHSQPERTHTSLFRGHSQVAQSVASMRARAFEIRAQTLMGQEIVVLKRRRWGTRCPRCWREKARAVVNGSCEVCYGTGYQGGYHTPAYCHGVLRVDGPSQVQRSDAGAAQPMGGRATLPSFPLVDCEDFVVELSRRRYFEVTSVDPKVVMGQRYAQKVGLSERSLTHIVCKLDLGPRASWSGYVSEV
jgi:hypothetical protein